jgi:glycosyltransferase involved in cell wall biosynthesis
MPAYNEAGTIAGVVDQLMALELPCEYELIVVDDGSADRTGEILDSEIAPTAPASVSLQIIHHPENRGKGAAVRTGIAAATGTHILIFDADTEYDPADIPRLVAPLLTGRAEVVFGDRMSGHGTVHPSIQHAVGNHLMTAWANMLYGSVISDLHTCLKLVPLPLLRSFTLTENGFGLDTEISAEILRAGFRPYELPISYVGRSKEEGKKIRISDAFRCIYILTRNRFKGRTAYGRRDRTLTPRVVAIGATK